MAKIQYNAGIPHIPAKWEAFLSKLLDSIGLSRVTISSTFRSQESNAAAMYDNLKTAGVTEGYKLYNDNMDKVVAVFEAMQKAGRNQPDTIKAMTIKAKELPLGVHCRPQNDSFCVFDIPPVYIPENMRGAFEKVMRENGKLIVPTKSKSEPAYHIEFGGIMSDAAKTATGIGGGAVALIAAIAFFLLKR